LGISKLPPAKASITQVSLASSCLRVHLRPLLEDVPFVGACTISFLKPPDFDFDLDGLANALSIPGISLLLRHVIQDQLEQTIVMPNSLTISLVENMDNIKSRNIRQHRPKDTVNTVVGIPSGVLNINVVEAKGLENKDITALGQGKSDPYAVLDVISDGEISTFKTHVIKNNLHPVWNVAVDLPVDNPESLQGRHNKLFNRKI
jgi:Ca2+-dependent lipid-binding protein